MKFTSQLFLVGLILISTAPFGLAQETNSSAQPPMTEEQKAMQARMQEYTTVNEHHDFLKSLAGTWKTKAKFWMDPKAPPEESEGTSEGKMIMDGHFLEQSF